MQFDRAFQKKIVSILLRSPRYAKQVAHMLDPHWIEDAALADIAEVSTDYIKKHGGPPSRLVIAQECGKDVAESAVYKSLNKLPLSDAAYAMEKFGQFCLNSAVKKALLDSAKDHADGNYGDIVQRMRKALSVGADTSDLGGFFRDLDRRKGWYLYPESYGNITPTPWPHINEIVSGGISPGELWLLLAGPKMGKTFGLINIGAYALTRACTAARQGLPSRVVHYTLELSEKKTYLRYDKLIAGKHAALLKNTPRKFLAQLERQMRRAYDPESELVVKQYPNKTLTASMIRAHLDALAAQRGFEPTLIIVDYLDEMMHEGKLDEKRFQLSQITSELRAIGVERNCAVWSATSTNKASLNAETTDIEHVSEDIGKVRTADGVISINATPEEYNEGRMRYYLAAIRDAQSKVTIDMVFDFERGYVRSIGKREPVKVVKSDSKDKTDEQHKRLKKMQKTQRDMPPTTRKVK